MYINILYMMCTVLLCSMLHVILYVCVCVTDGQTLSGASCRQAKQKLPWLECDDDGQYEPTQCRSDTECFCVDPQTGVPLDGSRFSRREADSVMCEGTYMSDSAYYAWVQLCWCLRTCMGTLYHYYTIYEGNSVHPPLE